ncbi:MAG: PAS domain S-box-containing protein [Hydrogenophaga sp.]|jgi:PAS domain S-box-containing protein
MLDQNARMNSSSPWPEENFATLFAFLPIGAYRSSPEGQMLRANPALVRLNGYDTEAELLTEVVDIARDWYVDPTRRQTFQQLMQRDGAVANFVSETQRHKARERIWISENAHVVLRPDGRVLCYEGTVEDISERVRDQQALQRSADELRLLTSQVPGMVYLVETDAEGRRRYRFVSERIRDIYGVSPEALKNEPELVVRYRHPDDQAQLERDAQAILREPIDLDGEFRIVMPDGQIKWLLRRSSAVREESTLRVRAGVLLDITEHKRTELALRETEARWRLAMEGAGDGVWDWNLRTNKEYFSTRIKAMFGFGEDEVESVTELLDSRTHPDDVPQMLRDRAAHFAGETPIYRNEHRVQCKDGSWKCVLSRGMVIARDGDGHPLRMVGTHSDITELKQAEAKQRLLEAQLRESQKMEAIGTLAGGVAHDFNNLLAAILGNLALAREDVGPEHLAQESLGEINRAAVRARQLVQQILAFSRRQAQLLTHQPLAPLVDEALALLRSLLPAGVQLTPQMGGGALPVLADATQIQQVLMNLCTNAWQALDGRAGEVIVALRPVRLDAARALEVGGVAAGTYACLSVADNGPGMDTATQQRIFEPFFTTKAPGAGTGLGLAVVHGIVKTHNGAIVLSSQPGEGARFDVYLPLAGATAAPQVAAVLPTEVQPEGQNSGRHVVYVDDYEAMVFLVGRLLRKQGYRVSTFTSGELALTWLREHPDAIDLLVTDQNMPGMSGVDLARASLRERPGLRVAIVSGHVNDKLLADASAVGVQEVMTKQDSMGALGVAIAKLLDAQLAPR